MMSCFFSTLRPANRRLVLAVFLLTGLSLFAQTYREARIFIPPVNGASVDGDNAFFYRQLNYEVVLQYHSLVRSRLSSDFILNGTIALYKGDEQFLIDHPQEEPEVFEERNKVPVPSRPIPRIRNTLGRREFFSWEVNGEIVFYDSSSQDNYEPETENDPVYYHESEDQYLDDYSSDIIEYVFTLELINNKTGGVVAKQYLIYRFVDDSIGDLVSIIVYNMLSNIPEIEADSDWRENWLFAGVTAMWAPRIYAGDEQSVSWVNFGLGASLEFHFLDFMSAGLGIQFVPDLVVVTALPNNIEYRDLMLELPLLVKFVFKPGQLMLEPYGGVSANFSLMSEIEPSLFSWFAGFQLGAKVGPGMIVVDPRFSMDFLPSRIPKSDVEYQRYLFQISIGYKFGFLPKYSRQRDY